jgi:hypothetical protein
MSIGALVEIVFIASAKATMTSKKSLGFCVEPLQPIMP